MSPITVAAKKIESQISRCYRRDWAGNNQVAGTIDIATLCATGANRSFRYWVADWATTRRPSRPSPRDFKRSEGDRANAGGQCVFLGRVTMIGETWLGCRSEGLAPDFLVPTDCRVQEFLGDCAMGTRAGVGCNGNHEFRRAGTMFDRLTTGWQLAKQSIRVLRLDKELLLFPLLSGVACILVLASFAIPIFLTGALDYSGGSEPGTLQRVLWFIVTFAFYFINYFIIIFFNSALVGCAVIRLKGGDPTVGDGIRAAMARIPQIAGWALVSATVGIILKAIESRSNRIGEIVSGILGMGWAIVTFFVIPVIVIEETGPIAAIKRSTSIMKSKWGESLAANFGIGIIVFFASLIAFLPIGLGFWFISAQWVSLGIALIIFGILLSLLTFLISSALNSIILAALYIYAAEGAMPEVFDRGMLQDAFRHK